MRPAPTLNAADTVRDQRAKFRPDIEGLRAVAVLAVVLFHAGVPWLGGGYVGVDVFFVISGFLITGLLWREVEATSTVRLRNFYAARARRLLPASAAVAAVTMAAAALLVPSLQVRAVIADGVTSTLYVGNYWFLARSVDYFGNRRPPSPFLHYWSLGVEEQFYLVWPVLILLAAWLIRAARRVGRAVSDQAPAVSARPYVIVLALVATGSLALSVTATLFAPAVAFFSLPTRAWQLALGGLVALTVPWWRSHSRRAALLTGWAGVSAIVVACVAFTPTTPYPGTAALLPTVGAVLVIGAGCAVTGAGIGRWLGTAPMRAVGQISYSWYLWHWPVLVLAPALVGHPLGLPARLFAVLLAAGLAVLTLRFLENPMRYAAVFRASPWRSIGLGGAVTALAVIVGVVVVLVAPSQTGTGPPQPPLVITAGSVRPGAPPSEYQAAVDSAFEQIQAAVTASVGITAIPSNLVPALGGVEAQMHEFVTRPCFRALLQDGQPHCISGDTAAATTVAVIGDSHAAMWTPGFAQLAADRHWRLQTLAKAGCPMMHLDITNPFRRLVEAAEHCKQWSTEILERLRAQPPELVVLSVWRGYGTAETMTGFTAYDQDWLDGLAGLVRGLRAIGSQVLVLGGIPDPGTDIPICVSGHPTDVSVCGRDRAAAVNAGGIAAERAVIDSAGGQYADLTALFCSADRPVNVCPAIVGNTLVYIDDSHVTPEYAKVAAPALGALAERALQAS